MAATTPLTMVAVGSDPKPKATEATTKIAAVAATYEAEARQANSAVASANGCGVVYCITEIGVVDYSTHSHAFLRITMHSYAFRCILFVLHSIIRCIFMHSRPPSFAFSTAAFIVLALRAF